MKHRMVQHSRQLGAEVSPKGDQSESYEKYGGKGKGNRNEYGCGGSWCSQEIRGVAGQRRQVYITINALSGG